MRFLKTLAKVIATTAPVSGTRMAMASDIAVIGGSNDDAFWNFIKNCIDDATLVANGGSVI